MLQALLSIVDDITQDPAYAGTMSEKMGMRSALLLPIRLEGTRLDAVVSFVAADVGHFTQEDEDRGEDKLEREARATGKDPWQVSREITAQFEDDLRRLRSPKPEQRPKATEHWGIAAPEEPKPKAPRKPRATMPKEPASKDTPKKAPRAPKAKPATRR